MFGLLNAFLADDMLLAIALRWHRAYVTGSRISYDVGALAHARAPTNLWLQDESNTPTFATAHCIGQLILASLSSQLFLICF